MDFNSLLARVQQMGSQADGLATDADRAQLKITVGSLQFEAAGGPDESVADLRDEFEAIFAHLSEQAEDADTGSSENVQEQIQAQLENMNAQSVSQTGRGVQ